MNDELTEGVHYCQERNTGNNYGGKLNLSKQSIVTHIYNFDDFFQIDDDGPIYLRTEHNNVASLHNNISNIPAQNMNFIGASSTLFTQKIISDILVLGQNNWEPETNIKCATFTVPKSQLLFHYNEKTRALKEHNQGETFDDVLLTVTTDEVKLTCKYKLNYNFFYDTPRSISPIFELQFFTDTKLSDYMKWVSCIVSFFAFSMGTHMQPRDIRICRLTPLEQEKAIEENGDLGSYSATYIWPKTEADESHLSVHNSVVATFNKSELKSTAECLETWLKRKDCWENANSMMMKCLSQRHEISSDRLLDACRWLEEIPNSGANIVIDAVDISNIAKTATAKAIELGHSAWEDRIGSAIRSTRTESRIDRFTRLVGSVQSKFGETLFPNSAVKDLKTAMNDRGKAAHGAFHSANQIEFDDLMRSIFVVEALCFLLSAMELPINSEGIKRIASNPFVEAYRHAH